MIAGRGRNVPEEFKTVVCKECGKDFEAKVVYFVRAMKPVPRVMQYCSPVCYKAYHARVTRRDGT
jgi:hypothetical protein